MATYILRGKYSPTAYQGMLASPSDRGQGAKSISSAVGAKMLDAFFSVTNGDAVVLIEGTKEHMAELQMITMASGAFLSVTIEELISTKVQTAAMKTAGAKAAKYKSPNKK